MATNLCLLARSIGALLLGGLVVALMHAQLAFSQPVNVGSAAGDAEDLRDDGGTRFYSAADGATRKSRAVVAVEETTSAGCDFLVTNTNDTGAGSLRQAITDANAGPGAETICFDIPGDGPHTIQPLSALPSISDPVTIDGLTQPGASCSSWPARA